MKILFATDGSKESDRAIEMLEQLRFGEGDAIKIISVVDVALPASFESFSYVPDASEMQKAATAHARNSLDSSAELLREKIGASGSQVQSEVLFGPPDVRIVECAEEFKADLIIVGSHDYSRWERLLVGSVSDSVVHHAPCSVLVVRNTK